MNKDGKVVGSVSQSLQMAPFDVWYMPDYGMFLIGLSMFEKEKLLINRLHCRV